MDICQLNDALLKIFSCQCLNLQKWDQRGGVNNFQLDEKKRDLLITFHTFTGLFPNSIRETEDFYIVSLESGNSAELYQAILALNLPRNTVKVISNASLEAALTNQFELNAMPTIVIGFGRYHDTNEETAILFCVAGKGLQ